MIFRTIFNKVRPFGIRSQNRVAIIKAIFNSTMKMPFCTIAKDQIKRQNKPKYILDEDKMDMLEEQGLKWQNNYIQVVSNYPFHHIPIALIRSPDKFNMDQSLKKDLIALKAITSRPQDLKLANQILFPTANIYKQLQITQDLGRKTFSQYMELKVPELIVNLNQSKGSFEERVGFVILLCNISKSVLLKDNIRELDERNIIKQDPSGVIAAYYLQLLIKNEMEYTHLLQFILQKLQSNEVAGQSKLKIAKAIITTPRFEEHFSGKIIDLAIKQISKNIQKMHNYEILFIIRNVYPYTSPQAKRFGQNLQKFLINKHIEEINIDYHIPLTLKVVRYCSKLKIPCKQLLQFMTVNMKRFKIIFEKKNISKGVFFNLLFSKYNKDLSPELVGHLKTYFLDNIGAFSKADEVEDSEMVRFNKLLIKYFQHFSEAQKSYIRNKYITEIIPHFGSSSDEILFYSLLVYLRSSILQPEKKQDMTAFQKERQEVKKYIQLYLKKCCTKNHSGQLLVKSHIESVIEMMYQVYRHKIRLDKEMYPFICKYSFDQKQTITPEIVSYFFSYLGNNEHESKNDIKSTLLAVQPTLQGFIRGHKIGSIKTIFNIMDVCDKVNFEHQFFYKLLENSFAEYLIKYPNFVIIEKDLNFINNKFIKRGYGSKGLKDLVLGTLERPNNWERLVKAYTLKEKEFLQSIQQKRREKRMNRYQ